MKKIILLYLVMVFTIVSSCKKESTQISEKKDMLPLSDSTTISINGKTYIYNGVGSSGNGNDDTNVKLDSIGRNNSYWYSGDKDSVYYNSTYRFYAPTITGSQPSDISFLFIKKFAKSQMLKSVLYIPTALDNYNIYYLGEHPYATDYHRENSQNGVAIELGGSTSYISLSKRFKSSLPANYQKNSKFEVISYKKQANGQWLLEAKFSVNVLDNQENITGVENGYLRLHTDVFFN